MPIDHSSADLSGVIDAFTLPMDRLRTELERSRVEWRDSVRRSFDEQSITPLMSAHANALRGTEWLLEAVTRTFRQIELSRERVSLR